MNDHVYKELGRVVLQQRESDAYFDATSLVNQHNELFGTSKTVNEFLEDEAAGPILERIQREPEWIMDDFVDCIDEGDYWLNPALLFPFARWLSAEMEFHVVLWFSDLNQEYVSN